MVPALDVHADPAALEQALANLLDNAVKYSAPHTPILVRVASTRNRAVVDVIDQGIGVAGADHARIFDRFFRAANAAHRPGFGLGLTIVRELVHAHGRQGRRPQCARPRQHLPIYAASRQRPTTRGGETPRRGNRGEAMTSHAFGTEEPRHILVVEDEPQMRAMLIDNLEFEGYGVTAVDTGEAALAELERTLYSLLIVDVMLPGISGFDVCRRLRDQGTYVPIILLTARTHERDRVRGLDWAPTTTSASRSACASCWRAYAPRSGATTGTRRPAKNTRSARSRCEPRQRLVLRNGCRLRLSGREFELLRYLIAHRTEVVSREQLLRDVWGYHEHSITRTVDNYVAKLRTHLERNPHDPQYIVTVHGSGYQFLS